MLCDEVESDALSSNNRILRSLVDVPKRDSDEKNVELKARIRLDIEWTRDALRSPKLSAGSPNL